MMGFDIAGLVADLGTIPTIADPARVKNKSRDFYWYSPILRDELEHVRADLVVVPESEADTIATMVACHARKIPVTPRGAGTGNYGQAMPIRGGVVLDLSALNAIHFIRRGAARAQAGVRLLDLDAAAQAQTGQEQRMHPSTLRSATIGGFICGGSGGVGSVTWGGLRDRGNVLGARVLTMENPPRVLELRGDDVQKVIHAYGTTGIVTEVEIALAQAPQWIDTIVAFDDFAAAAGFAHTLACQDALLKKLVAVLAAPIPEQFIKPIALLAGSGRHVVLTMIADIAFAAFESLLRRWPGRIVHRHARDAGFGDAAGARDAGSGDAGSGDAGSGDAGSGDAGSGDAGSGDAAGSREATTAIPRLLPIYEYAWNHTTLHALKVDRAITYHQTLHPAPDSVRTAVELHRRFGDEVLQHLEFVRFDGGVACYGLPLIRFTTAHRLREIEAVYESIGCSTFSPHTVTLEDGGMKQVDRVQLAFKRETDPLGLLNPGKMLGWEDPHYVGAQRAVHLFAGVSGAGAPAEAA